jgi:hypothetical protein
VRELALACLWQLGSIAELRTRMTRLLDDADHRGDLYAATELRTTVQPLLCLMDDREPAARDALARAEASLPRHEVTMLHWQHTQQRVLVELYAGAPAKAVELMERHAASFRRAFLFRAYIVRCASAFHRATAWLGVLAEGTRDPAQVCASIARVCRGLDDHAMARPLRVVIDAGLAVLRGDRDAAVTLYREAATGFDALGMLLNASATRWRLGELLGGDEGRTLVAQATTELSAEGIVRPDRVIAIFASVPADARQVPGLGPRLRV